MTCQSKIPFPADPGAAPATALEAARSWSADCRTQAAVAPMSAAEASQKVEEVLERVVLAALAWKPEQGDEDARAPGAGMGASAGLGKTEIGLRLIARHGRALLDRGHVLLQFPTLALAEEAYRRFQDLGTGLPAFVMRGRTASDPLNPGQQMCDRAEILEGRAGAPTVARRKLLPPEAE